jgi:AAA15 family ATPase/GTPase
MENAIHTLRIQNFKSIKDVTLQPRRVNLIIGQPNVGKSNILEAMSLLGGMFFDDQEDKFMEGQIRYEDLRNLFYDNDLRNYIKVEYERGGILISKESGLHRNAGTVSIFFHNTKSSLNTSQQVFMEQINHLVSQYLKVEEMKGSIHLFRKELGDISIVDNIFSVDGNKVFDKRSAFFFYNPPVLRKYAYAKIYKHGNSYDAIFLRPPYGDNMVDVLQYSGSKLRKEIAELFKPYGLNFAVRVADRKFEIQKNVDGYVYDYPYSLIADTLQRIIFYLAAIESNDDSVLLFEEPEAHTFPVYTSMLGRKIADSRNNQFFVATHSPYLVTEILEQMLPDDNQAGELAIFLAYYEDYQTKVKQLSDEEIRDIRNDSIDVFYNLSRFTPGSNLYA